MIVLQLNKDQLTDQINIITITEMGRKEEDQQQDKQ